MLRALGLDRRGVYITSAWFKKGPKVHLDASSLTTRLGWLADSVMPLTAGFCLSGG
jgi:hypothetical protein